jgi:hypothetical protein
MEHIGITFYGRAIGALLYLHCMEYGIWAKDWLCVREDIWGKPTAVKRVRVACARLFGLRVIEILSKRMCSSRFRASPACCIATHQKKISA